jgi:hypothetical protein
LCLPPFPKPGKVGQPHTRRGRENQGKGGPARPTFSTLKNSPVCTQLAGANKDAVDAFAQTAPPHTDIYINPTRYKHITQGTILHELLHNLTDLEDFVSSASRQEAGVAPPFDLKTFVGIETTPGVDPAPDGSTSDIAKKLEDEGCVDPN